MMLFTRSVSTGELVRSTGSSRWPLPSPSLISASSGDLVVPGSHSTKRSGITARERSEHLASLRNGTKRASSIFRITAAFLRWTTSSDSTTPTFAPATRTSSPGTRPVALSKIARTS